MRKCSLKSETQLKKEGRDAFDVCIDLNSNCSIVRLYDNKAVQLALKYLFTEPVDTAPRWLKKEKKYMDVSRPHIVKFCSSNREE